MDVCLPLPQHRLQVLYVEDGGAQRTLMQALFGLRPHLDLQLARDGAQATAMAFSLCPALLLMGIRLPDCLGSELLPLLRLRFGWRGVPAVAVTSEPDFEPGRASFVEVWRQPIDAPRVLSRLDDWLPVSPQFAPPAASSPQTVTRLPD